MNVNYSVYYPFKNNVLVHSCSLPVFMNTIKEKFSHPPLLNTSRNAHIYALVPFMDIHHNNGVIKIKNSIGFKNCKPEHDMEITLPVGGR